jgi:S1-C subfamily serine protease
MVCAQAATSSTDTPAPRNASDITPARHAGIRAGDILRKLGPHEIRNLYDFTYALRAHAPGETLDAWVEREGKLLRLPVTLGSR